MRSPGHLAAKKCKRQSFSKRGENVLRNLGGSRIEGQGQGGFLEMKLRAAGIPRVSLYSGYPLC